MEATFLNPKQRIINNRQALMECVMDTVAESIAEMVQAGKIIVVDPEVNNALDEWRHRAPASRTIGF